MSEPILELRQATKKYAGVPAIEEVDFTLLRGEIHALVGENGAGKSTLTKVMAGVVNLSSGQMLIEGTELPSARSVLASPSDTGGSVQQVLKPESRGGPSYPEGSPSPA